MPRSRLGEHRRMCIDRLTLARARICRMKPPESYQWFIFIAIMPLFVCLEWNEILIAYQYVLAIHICLKPPLLCQRRRYLKRRQAIASKLHRSFASSRDLDQTSPSSFRSHWQLPDGSRIGPGTQCTKGPTHS